MASSLLVVSHSQGSSPGFFPWWSGGKKKRQTPKHKFMPHLHLHPICSYRRSRSRASPEAAGNAVVKGHRDGGRHGLRPARERRRMEHSPVLTGTPPVALHVRHPGWKKVLVLSSILVSAELRLHAGYHARPWGCW